MKLTDINWNIFQPFKNNNKPSTQMKEFDKFSKILGRAITSENIGAVTADEWEKVNAHSDTPALDPAAPETPDPSAEKKPDAQDSAPLTAESLQGIITTALAPITERLSKLEKGPAAGSTIPPIKTGDEKVAQHSWESPETDPFMALAKKELDLD
jgi:hypothetical protein